MTILNIIPNQQYLFPVDKKDHVKFIIESVIGCDINLTITDNISSLLSAKKKNGIYFVRLSSIFLEADDNILKDLALFIIKKQKISDNVKSFIKSYLIKPKARKKHVTLKHEGIHFNVLKIFNRLNQDYFDGKVNAKITWGKKNSRKKKLVRTRLLGNYCQKDHLIRINPILDRAEVPVYYIEFIVYHEMLHAFLGIKKVNGRRAAHTKEFKEKERLFLKYKEAIQWEQHHKF